ncbi:hypothetical protein LV164_004344 [Aspergillus fumigatus]|nr:hypothetical protein KXX42_000528 [Aspergillus fumigatus]KAH1549690.1 hypothetical protein KXX57_000657 [Aspergillus fumigatus]KAH1915584.1 hypothetical protein KXW47_002956 [Aspergillus fumigatus]KAH1976937.1 hypothetical protein KXW88_008789 [Aspergillus fumigatus]KAH2170469.1 hypothetical protein KXV74_000613 [Aspergillus fumigatus]
MKQVVDLDSSAPLATLAQCELNQFQDQISQPLIGIGHSMGGMQLAHLSLMHPGMETKQPVAVTLTTPKAQELFTFLRSSYIDERSGLPRGIPQHEMRTDDIDGFPFYRPEPPKIVGRLPELKPAVLYIFGKSSDFSSPDARQEKLQTTGIGVGGSGSASRGWVQEVVLPCGHLVPMDCVTETAQASADLIGSELLFGNRKLRSSRKLGEVSHIVSE